MASIMSRKRTKGIKLRRVVVHSAIPQPKGKTFRQMKMVRAIGAKIMITITGNIKITKATPAKIIKVNISIDYTRP
jgi:hypothetical protein